MAKLPNIRHAVSITIYYRNQERTPDDELITSPKCQTIVTPTNQVTCHSLAKYMLDAGLTIFLQVIRGDHCPLALKITAEIIDPTGGCIRRGGNIPRRQIIDQIDYPLLFG